MKAIKMRIQKHSRPLVILLATAVVIITTMVVANATQVITTPNAASISYSLAAGGNSAAITPAINKPVLVMGCETSMGDIGISHVSLLHSSIGGGAFIAWSGVESFNGATPATTGGGSPTAGDHIVFIDATHLVSIQVNSADTIRVHNGDAVTRAGNVTLIW
ncbi:MAG TPA: hypothetical protein VGI41_10960 [Candidatus Udaeobacter sp.]|jgi:hypothetical protein